MQMCSVAHYTVGIKDSAESFLFEVRTFGSIFLTFFITIFLTVMIGIKAKV